MTNEGGDRVYVKLETREQHSSRMNRHAKKLKEMTQHMRLGDTPIEVMLRELDDEELGERVEAADVVLDEQAERDRLDMEFEAEEEERLNRVRKKISKKKAAKKRAEAMNSSSTVHDLWVDKYAPSSYTDLLSDEKMNREVLMWLKDWDPCVFGTPRIVKEGEEEADDDGGLGSMRTRDKRPEFKAILLTGPPGLGKTTLAHIVAKVAGYNSVEINASDDRSESALMDQVRNAVEMKSVFSSKRPNCLVIDEIDGAMGGSGSAGAINALVRLIKGDDEKEEEGGKNGDGAPKDKNKKKNKKDSFKLNRPIICICNDQYAPALRPLRKVVKIYNFQRPTTRALADRLGHICRWEQMKTTSSALLALCEMMENDVRACLNVLQFVHSRGGSFLVEDLSSLALGHKDVIRDRLSMWKKIFEVGCCRYIYIYFFFKCDVLACCFLFWCLPAASLLPSLCLCLSLSHCLCLVSVCSHISIHPTSPNNLPCSKVTHQQPFVLILPTDTTTCERLARLGGQEEQKDSGQHECRLHRFEANGRSVGRNTCGPRGAGCNQCPRRI